MVFSASVTRDCTSSKFIPVILVSIFDPLKAFLAKILLSVRDASWSAFTSTNPAFNHVSESLLNLQKYFRRLLTLRLLFCAYLIASFCKLAARFSANEAEFVSALLVLQQSAMTINTSTSLGTEELALSSWQTLIVSRFISSRLMKELQWLIVFAK